MRAILFPGQGAQYVGMGKAFCEQSPAAREIFQRADEALGMELSRICFEGPEARLQETDTCQPAILTVSAALLATLAERGLVQPGSFSAAAGLSLGEYTALYHAGVFSFEDAVRLVRIRGQAMQAASELTPSGMVSLLGVDAAAAQVVCDKYAEGEVLVCANLLSARNIAVSGSLAATQRVALHAAAEGVRRAIPLKVAGAFHSPLMQPACARLEEALSQVKLSEPCIPVISNVTARPHEGSAGVADLLVRQVTSSVLWDASMQYLLGMGVKEIWEPGPGAVLSGLMKQLDRSVTRINVDQWQDLEACTQQDEAG